jgi:hypothetical protein
MPLQILNQPVGRGCEHRLGCAVLLCGLDFDRCTDFRRDVLLPAQEQGHGAATQLAHFHAHGAFLYRSVNAGADVGSVAIHIVVRRLLSVFDSGADALCSTVAGCSPGKLIFADVRTER